MTIIKASLRPYGSKYRIEWVDGFNEGLSVIGENKHDIHLVDQNLEADSQAWI